MALRKKQPGSVSSSLAPAMGLFQSLCWRECESSLLLRCSHASAHVLIFHFRHRGGDALAFITVLALCIEDVLNFVKKL